VRELKLNAPSLRVTKFDPEAYFFTFYEDGTYERSWSSEVKCWKFECIDNVITLIYNVNADMSIWNNFFTNNEETRDITEIIHRWKEGFEFDDAVDSILDVDPDHRYPIEEIIHEQKYHEDGKPC
jgi:hypothetical protein